MDRARTAPLRHGLYATEPTLKSTVNASEYASLREAYHAIWNPANQYLSDKVDDLVAYRWELNRLREVRRQHLATIFNQVGEVIAAEREAGAKGSTIDRFDQRIRRCNLEISRIERDIVRDAKYFSGVGASHNPLKTQVEEPELNPAEIVSPLDPGDAQPESVVENPVSLPLRQPVLGVVMPSPNGLFASPVGNGNSNPIPGRLDPQKAGLLPRQLHHPG
jgi:hypothetical protein